MELTKKQRKEAARLARLTNPEPETTLEPETGQKPEDETALIETLQDARDRESAVLAKKWRQGTFAAIDAASVAERSTSDFIFGRIQEAASIQAAEIAFASIEAAWQTEHTTKVVQSTGPKAGTEIEVKPPLPASWRVLKSRILKLCKDGPAIAARAKKAETIYAARKAMHMDDAALMSMYKLIDIEIGPDDVVPALSCQLADYAGNLAAYRDDVKAAQSFVSKFAPAVEVKATGAPGTGEKPLPGPVLTSLGNLNRAIRTALEAGIGQDAVEAAIVLLTADLAKRSEMAASKRRDDLLKRQRLDSISTILKSKEMDRAEAEAETQAS